MNLTVDKKVHLFVCQDCNFVVQSTDWEKYHISEHSCPMCKGDMCGCPSCVYSIKDENLKIGLIDIK